MTAECRYKAADGEWKSGKNFRGSAIPVLVYCLHRAHDWILARRDPSNADS